MGTHYQGTKTEVRALNGFITLLRAAESVSSRLARRLDTDQLTGSQFGILETLWHLGPMQQSELGKKLLKSSGNITLVVDNLQKQQLVQRERMRDDRRRITVSLTEKGQQLISDIFPRYVAYIVEEMRTLTAAEQDVLRTLCRRLGHQDVKAQKKK